MLTVTCFRLLRHGCKYHAFFNLALVATGVSPSSTDHDAHQAVRYYPRAGAVVGCTNSVIFVEIQNTYDAGR